VSQFTTINQGGTTFLIREGFDLKSAPYLTKYGYLYNGKLYSYMELAMMDALDKMSVVEIPWHYPEEQQNEFPKYVQTKIHASY
jgi:hypothetical protein